MLKPRALRSGDRVAVVAPASPFDRDEFDRGVSELQALGFEPVFDERVFERRGYVAGDADLRAAAFRDAWRDPSIAGVVAARGGYGSAHILPRLDPDEVRRTPKVFLGYSDLTSILIYLTTWCGTVCFHGPTVAGCLGRGGDGYDAASLRRVMMDPAPAGPLSADSIDALRPGEASGVLVGGTLTQILASLATPFAFEPPESCVLFIDEVGERPYRLDRMVTQLRYSGVLARASALVWGELPRCDEPGGQLTARAVIADLLRDFPGPVLFGFPSGHTHGPAMTLPFGVQARVVADARPRLIIEEAAVA